MNNIFVLHKGFCNLKKELLSHTSLHLALKNDLARKVNSGSERLPAVRCKQ